VNVPRLNDYGETISKPGRRSKGYTKEEYIESFFGKDMARRANVEALEDKTWKTQERMRDRFPKKSFLKMPAVEEKQRKIDELGFGLDASQYPHLKV
jgi:hypothetical protein